MKLKFDPSLEYQQDAINAVVNVLEGQPIVQSSFEISAGAGDSMKLSDLGVGNHITLSDDALLANIHKIQEQNGIEKSKNSGPYGIRSNTAPATGLLLVPMI